MKVLILYQYFVTNDVAGTTRPYELAQRLLCEGDEVTIVTGDSIYFTGQRTAHSGFPWKRDNVGGIDVIRVHIPFGGSKRIWHRIIGFLWFVPVGLLAALLVQKPDVVVGSSTPLTMGIPAFLVSRWRNIPFVFELRDLWPDHAVVWNIVHSRFLIRAAYWLESFLYRKATVIVALTDGIRQKVVSKGIKSNKVHVITNASNLTLFNPEGPRADLQPLGIPRDAFVCLYIGSLGLANYTGLILEVAEHFREHASVHFLIIGAGTLQKKLAEEVRTRGLQNVHLKEPIPKAMVPHFVRSAHLGIAFIKPSDLTFICLPNKFFDYMACGCPTMINFEGEARRYLELNNAGVCISPDDSRAAAKAIRELADCPSKMLEMRRNARCLAEKTFGWNHKAIEFREVLFAALHSNSKKGDTDDIAETELQAGI